MGLSPIGLRGEMQTRPPPSNSANRDLQWPAHCSLLVSCSGTLFAWSSALLLTPSECPSVKQSSVQTPASPGSFFHHLITNPPASPLGILGVWQDPSRPDAQPQESHRTHPQDASAVGALHGQGLLQGVRGQTTPLL